METYWRRKIKNQTGIHWLGLLGWINYEMFIVVSATFGFINHKPDLGIAWSVCFIWFAMYICRDARADREHRFYMETMEGSLDLLRQVASRPPRGYHNLNNN